MTFLEHAVRTGSIKHIQLLRTSRLQQS